MKRGLRLLAALIVGWNILAVLVCLWLDAVDPYYDVTYEKQSLSEMEILEECPSLPLTEEERLFLENILRDAAVEALWPPETGDPHYLSEEDCARLLEAYPSRPSDICRIYVSRSQRLNTSRETYVYAAFYDTEADKSTAPAVSYPCLTMKLKETEYFDYYDETMDMHQETHTDHGVQKNIYLYTGEKISTGQELYPERGTHGGVWGAAYTEYAYAETPGDQASVLSKYQRSLTPHPLKHVYYHFFGWWHAMMSV